MTRPQRRPRSLAALAAIGLAAGACVSISTGEGADAGVSPGPPVVTPDPGSSAGASPVGASPAAGSPAPASPGPSRAPGAIRIGYISLDERVPFARSVTAGVRAEAERAGVELVVCDPALSPQASVACGDELGRLGIDGLISFQGFPTMAADICARTGSVPTVGIGFPQGPCEMSRVRLDQAESGRVAGEAMGRFASRRWDCEIDAYVSLEASAAGSDAIARMAGYREGFERHCPIPPAADIVLDGADRVATAEAQVERMLRRTRGSRIVVVGLNEDAILGAIEAAVATGRTGDLWYSGQGADPSIRRTIACDRQYVASVAHFPERYGAIAVPVLLDALAGEAVPDIIDGPLELVTADDIRRLYPGTESCGE